MEDNFTATIDTQALAKAAFERFSLSKYSGAGELSILDWRAVMRLRRIAVELARDGLQEEARYMAAVLDRIGSDPLSTLMFTEKSYPPAVTEMTVLDACMLRESVADNLPNMFETAKRIEAHETSADFVYSEDATPEQSEEFFQHLREIRGLRDELSVSYRKAMEEVGISDGFCMVFVDCNAPDDVLTENFKEWLAQYREQTGKISGVSESDMRRWAQHRVLPYIDLKIIAKVAGIKLTNYSIGCKIFPDIETDVAEKVRKTTGPLADWLLGFEGEEVINALANDAQRKLVGKNWGLDSFR